MKNINLLYNTIYDIFKEFNNQYDSNTIEELIIDTIIVLIWKKLELPFEYFTSFSGRKHKGIIRSDIYEIIKQEIPIDLIDEEYTLPNVYEFLVKRRDKKEKYGIYYTSKWIVKYLVDNTLGEYLNSFDDIETIKILEPGCGCGVFLFYIFDILYENYCTNKDMPKEKIVKSILQNNIYAIDIDNNALKICNIIIKMKVLKKLGKFIDVNPNVFLSNYLTDDILDEIKFDFIIGNPPYLENRKINKYFNKEFLKKKYESAIGRFDIYSLFIEKSLNLLDFKGKLAFILPGNLLTNNNFTCIRKLILNTSKICEIIKLGHNIFKHVDMNMAIIILQKNSSRLKKK
ncbi:HsdM family class I SAM-dependent methyltransferase [Thermohalobacter berrensis]|uniref:site-specific DNA-methyltransferase (adenine-specific) n=1 Tax=Thermohalobacter berrensis TaxID=99594 RepID=A0A419T4N2_9FIRM|nr:N-6 DNA methylase [Thermohalobacter berrensis]RKD32441.1 hypothetical protein BET03_11025 [Thermohalobacter berrensis]